MQDILSESLKKLKKKRVRRTRMLAILLVLSLVVSLDVFWSLRQPGLTLAGDADCGITEHTHDESCQNEQMACQLIEHVHTTACYSDETMDVESQLDWQKMFAGFPYTGELRKDLVGIAKMQVGYSESASNFMVDDNGVRHGYTRYGDWYGVSYSNWNAIFVSFCLHYAKADPSIYPPNTGASAMADAWKKQERFADAGEYIPVSGDLVFLRDNTVGIITDVQRASCYVIRGDIDNAVHAELMNLNSPDILGWGITREPMAGTTLEAIPEKIPSFEEQTPSQNKIHTSGPVFTIDAEEALSPRSAVRTYSLRSPRTTTHQLLEYLANPDVNGKYFFTITDENDKAPPKDENGNYIVVAEKHYTLTVTFTANAFAPGIYEYQVPNGLMVDGGEGVFHLVRDNTTVGNWTVTDTGLITMVFNENMNDRSDVTISASLGIHFPEQDDPIDFDGKISVSVSPMPEDKYPTTITKGGVQGGTQYAHSSDSSKICWSVTIAGNKDSLIPGHVITDRIYLGEWSKSHHYIESDIAGGLNFYVWENNREHTWHVDSSDPHLDWTEDGWSYKMPLSVFCNNCWAEHALGNEGWYYTISYTSTPDPMSSGTFGYQNVVYADGVDGWGWADFDHGTIDGHINKTGTFVSDAEHGAFLWEFQTIIPGREEGKQADFQWSISDQMWLLDKNGTRIRTMDIDVALSKVTAVIGNQTLEIPRIQYATPDDNIVWDVLRIVDDGKTSYSINLLSRCTCDDTSCALGGTCGGYWYTGQDGTMVLSQDFCQCWLPTEEILFTFVYETRDAKLIEQYGNMGYQLQNVATLYYNPEKNYDAQSSTVDSSVAVVQIPQLFKKELYGDYNGFMAHYKITVNEAKIVLTDGSPLNIHDEMTDTLVYLNGSLIITTEDANGNTATLVPNVDFTAEYDGSGKKTDENGKPVHVLDIKILHPQPVKYILDYDTTLIIPDEINEGLKYANSATITLWGDEISSSEDERIFAEFNIASNAYKIKLKKISAETGLPLAGAVFGLYNEHGGLITSLITEADGTLTFKTDIINGIVLLEHKFYYVQEIKAPSGYQLDDTQHWLCFCNDKGDSCSHFQGQVIEHEYTRIPFGQDANFTLANTIQNYDLPATGGQGTFPLILVSVIFIVTPLVYRFIRRRKRERRGDG